MDIILASNSPRRRQLLKKICDFKVVVSNVEEKTCYVEPIKYCKSLALLKARAVAKDFFDSVVIGADTIVVCNDKIIGKPKDDKQNFEILKMLSGSCHYVYTGYAILYKGKEITGAEKTKVVFNELSNAQIMQYVLSGSGLDKAGGYGIQDNDFFVKEIVGSFDNVVGFPTEKIKLELEKIKEDNL